VSRPSSARRPVQRRQRIVQRRRSPTKAVRESTDLRDAPIDVESLGRKDVLSMKELICYLGFPTYGAAYMAQERHLAEARLRTGRSLRFDRREVDRLIGKRRRPKHAYEPSVE
jgi:hypothetical protein